MRTISVKLPPSERGVRGDSTPAVSRALSRAMQSRDLRLVFERATYHFRPQRARELLCFVSNNDSGLQRIAFPVVGARGVTIDGQGSRFVFHGAMTPFLLENARDITLRNLTIDWHDPHLAQGTVVGASRRHIDFRMHDNVRWRIDDEHLYLSGEEWEERVSGLLEMDPSTRAPQWGSRDNCGAAWHSRYRFSRRESGIIRMRNEFGVRARDGNVLVLATHTRRNPGMVISNTRNLHVDNVTVHHARGMALIAQRSVDIRVTRMQVCVPRRSSRLFSASADATHFVNCRGSVRLEDCRFEHMLDDATNVHGIYLRVEKILSSRTLLLCRVHTQQAGAPVLGDGDTVQVAAGGTLQPGVRARISGVQPLNAQFLEATLHRSVKGAVREGDVLENLTWTADAVIRGCTARMNRARSFLVQTPGRVVVSGNTMSSGGPGVLVGAEASFWYEAGAARDITIEGNLFENCNYGPWGNAAVDITPGAVPLARGPRFERGIRVVDNTFRVFDPRIVHARNTEDLVVSGNRIERSTRYRSTEDGGPVMTLDSCGEAHISGNDVDWQNRKLRVRRR